MNEKLSSETDHADTVYDAWARERPDISTVGAQIFAGCGASPSRFGPRSKRPTPSTASTAANSTVLATLRRSGAPYCLRPTELYRLLMISSGGLTDRLDRLEAAGLILRRPSPEDARSLLAELTPAGREKVEAAFAEDMALCDTLAGGLSAEERDGLIRLLRKLAIEVGA